MFCNDCKNVVDFEENLPNFNRRKEGECMRKLVLLFVIVFMLNSFVTANYSSASSKINTKRLKQLANEFKQKEQERKEYALTKAEELDLPIIIEGDGVYMELSHFDEFDNPIYRTTHNANAAITISTDHVYSGGVLGLDLSGNGIIIREWDGGGVLTTHQEFGSRVTQVDSPSSTHYHSTHVAGTMIASGVQANAKGMAYAASLRAFDWTDDTTEMANEALNPNMLLSNHSYGFGRGWTTSDGYTWSWAGQSSPGEDWSFGHYNTYSQEFDEIAYNAPHYLIVESAGNDRGDGPGSDPDHPDADGPYDCVADMAVSKNVLTVAATEDMTSAYTDPSDVVITSFSSWGPCDDGRIKPDISANGAYLYSTFDDNNSAYDSISGTSMAAPSVTGSLALIQEHYDDLNGTYLSAAQLKALTLHCADEAGSYDGPDYTFGWGLMNTARMAEYISNEGTSIVIDEQSLTNGGNYSTSYTSNGVDPFKVTIVWMDPAATPVALSLDPTDKMLVNDLDMRISQGASTYYPWSLDGSNPSNAATNSGDNDTDNVEQVYIASPSAVSYTITVNHKGSLSSGSQDFAIIVSGIATGNPVCSITSPANGANIEEGTIETIQVTASDPAKSVSSVAFYIDDMVTPVYTDSDGAPYEYSWDTTGESIGSHSIRAIVTDNESNTGTSQIAVNVFEPLTVPFTEDFENGGSIPINWTQEVISGSASWTFTGGNGSSNPSTAYEGSYNALLKDSDSTDDKILLVTPEIDFGSLTDNTQLTFYHYMQDWSPDQDELAIYYKTSAGGSWNLIQSFTSSVSSWTKQTVSLPNANSTYYIGFEGNAKYGYGVCIDYVEVTGNASTPPVFSLNPTSLNFGNVEVGSNSTLQFTITNNGGGTLSGNITTPSGYTVAMAKGSKEDYSKSRNVLSYSTSTSQTFDLIFEPTTTGEIGGDVVISSNDTGNPSTNLTVTGTGTQAIIGFSDTTFDQTLPENNSATDNLTIMNSGTTTLTYSASIVYSKGRAPLLSENFDSGIPSGWNVTDSGTSSDTWINTDGSYLSTPGDLDGTNYMMCDSDAAGSGVTMNETFTSPVIPCTGYDPVTLEFDHYFRYYSSGGTEVAEVEVYDGSQWQSVYASSTVSEGEWSNPDHETITITQYANANMQIRFRYYDAEYDWWWAIDNVLVTGTQTATWLTINGSNSNSDSISLAGSDNITIGYNTSTLTEGNYSADINISSNDSASPHTIDITLHVNNTNDNTATGGGNNGSGTGAATADLPPIVLDGNIIDPDIDVDPGGEQIAIEVTVSDVNMLTNPVQNPDAVGIAYNISITGSLPATTNFTLYNLDDLANYPNEVSWWNGSSWLTAAADWSTANQVSFNLTLSNSKDGSTEIVLNKGGESPLPVSLSTFNAYYNNRCSLLEWTTQSELNNSHWNVYRGESENYGQAEISNAEPITGAGTTFEPTDYQYYDPNEVVANKTYWYWIENIDFSGQNQLYGPASILIPEDHQTSNPPEVPTKYGLYANYPNPFNPNTQISFALHEASNVDLIIYDAKGRKIKKLLMGENVPADQIIRIDWNGTDEYQKEVASGVYLYRLITKNKEYTKKMMMIK